MRAPRHRLWPALLILYALVLVPSQAAQANPLVMFTSFDPFDGGAVNNSRLVADRLVSLFSRTSIDLYHCEVHTIYDVSFEESKNCLLDLELKEGKKPDFIISLGEGSNSCDEIDLETQTENLDNTSLPDNVGVVHQHKMIIPDAEKVKKFNFYDSKVDSILSVLPQFKPSSSMGNYVCNNLAFRMTHFLENSVRDGGIKIPYTFMHVPDHSCGKTSKKTARLIERFIQNIL